MDKLKKLMAIIKAYTDKNFYGKIEVSLESGNIVNLKVTENIKL